MVQVRLSFVPPGGGEVDYGLTMELPALPRSGDYISIKREGPPTNTEFSGSEDFIVRRVWWYCSYPDDGKYTHLVGNEPIGTAEVNVECEFALSPFSSEDHKRSAKTGKRRSDPQEFEDTNY